MHKNKNRHVHYINCIISVGIMLLGRFLPAPYPMTSLGMEILGIFIGMLYGWLIVGNLAWPSFIGMILLGLSDYSSVPDVLKNGFGNSNVLLVLFFMVFANIINRTGVTEYIARTFVTVKFAKGRPYVLMLMILLAMFVVEIFLSVAAAMMLMLPLVFEICKLYDIRPGEKFATVICVGVLWIGNACFMLMPYHTMPALILPLYSELSGGDTFNFGMYCLINLIFTAAVIVTFLIYCKVIKLDVSKLKKDLAIKDAERLSTFQKGILLYFVIIILLLIMPTIAPETWAITQLLSAIGNNGVLLLGIALYLMMDFKDGLSVGELFSRGISWGSLFLLAGALTVGGATQSENTGIPAFIEHVLTPMLEGKSVLLFMIILIVSCSILTNLANDVAVAAILAPVFYTLALPFGVNMPTVMLVVGLSCLQGIATPPSSVPAAIMFGFSNWCPSSAVSRHAWTAVILHAILILIIVYPLGLVLL